MTLTNRLQKTQPENLRKLSDKVLESDTALLTLGADEGYTCINILDKKTSDSYRFSSLHGDEWMMEKNTERLVDIPSKKCEELSNIFIDNTGDLGKFSPPYCGPLMQKAICGLGYSINRSSYKGTSYMDVALKRAGLVVSKNGKVTEEMIPRQEREWEI